MHISVLRTDATTTSRHLCITNGTICQTIINIQHSIDCVSCEYDGRRALHFADVLHSYGWPIVVEFLFSARRKNKIIKDFKCSCFVDECGKYEYGSTPFSPMVIVLHTPANS